MHLTFRGGCLGFATILVLGCSSRSTTTYPDAQAIDAGNPEGRPGVDAGPDVTKPAPMSGGGNVLLFAGPAQLLAEGRPCTHELDAAGDRWCAFIKPSTTSFDSFDLFVINVSRAAAGVPIRCGGAVVDLNCLKLTGGFYEDATRPAQFQGDTLVYFDETGTPYAWRPGMVNGRALATTDPVAVHDCFGAPKGSAVVCLRDLPTSTIDVTQSDLVVGRVDDPADPPLKRIETVVSFNAADGQRQRFQNGFPTPAGDVVAWSSQALPSGGAGGAGGAGPAAAPGVGGAGGTGSGTGGAGTASPVTLKVQRVDDASTRRAVATDVNDWNASADGTRFFWLSEFNSTSGIGILQTAANAVGAAPTTLLADVRDYAVVPNGGVAARTSTSGLRGFPDPAGAPGTMTTIDNGVLGIVSVSRLGHIAYAKSFDPILQVIDLHVRKLDATGMPCTLSSRQESPIFAPFLPGGGAIVWARFDLNTPFGDQIPATGLLTSLSDCKTMTVASQISNLGAAGDEGVLFTNEGDRDDATLRVRNVADGKTLSAAGATLIQTRVDNFVAVFPSPGAVVFTVNAGSSADGIYLHVFTAPPRGSGRRNGRRPGRWNRRPCHGPGHRRLQPLITDGPDARATDARH